MWTISYKGHFIHGYFDRAECRVQSPEGEILGTRRSFRAALIFITKTTKRSGK